MAHAWLAADSYMYMYISRTSNRVAEALMMGENGLELTIDISDAVLVDVCSAVETRARCHVVYHVTRTSISRPVTTRTKTSTNGRGTCTCTCTVTVNY